MKNTELDMQNYIEELERRQKDLEQQKEELLLCEQNQRDSQDTFFHANHSIMLLIDPETGEIKDANPAASRFYGWSRSEICQKNISQINILSQTEIMAEMALAKSEFRNHFVFKHILANGEIRDVEVYSGPIRYHDATILYSNVYDISDRLKAEMYLRKNEEKYRNIVETINDVVYEISNEGTIKYVSPSVIRILGYTAEEVLGKNIISFIHPEDRKWIAERVSTLVQKDYNYLEYRYINKEGGTRWVRSSTTAIFDNGKMVGGMGTLTDITSRKLAEDEVMINNLKWEAIISASPDGIGMVTLDGRLLLVSDKLAELYGYQVSEKDFFIGKSVFDFVDSSEHQKLKENIEKILVQQLNSNSVEYLSIRKDQSRFFSELNSTILFDKNGHPESILYVQRDITYRKIAEHALLNKNSILTNLIINLQEGILLEDSDRKIALTNQLFCDMFGIQASPEVMIGADCSRSAEESKCFFKNPDKFIADIELILKNKKADFNYNLELVDGRHFERDYIPTYLEQKYSGHLWKYRDVTQRKQAEKQILELNENLEQKVEERTKLLTEANDSLIKQMEVSKHYQEALSESERSYRTVVENVSEVIFQTDTDGLWQFLNKSWEEVTGFSVEESLGKSFENFIHPDDKIITGHFFESILTREKEYCRFKIRCVTKTGSYRWIEVFVRLALDEYNQMSGMLGTLQDITEQKKVEEEIIQSRDEAEKANRAKSEFLSRMSHELRTPLNSILGFSQLMEMSEINATYKKRLNHISSNGKHLLNLINEVLDIAGIESGRQLLTPEPVQLIGIINEVIDIVQVTANKRNIGITLAPSPSNNLFVEADKLRLKQVLLNLIANAIKYNKEDGIVNIHTAMQPTDSQGNAPIRISISDTGIGINPNDISKLFQPFERIGADKTQTEGTGLGLMVVMKLTEAMNGKVGVESDPGAGSTFWIELPQSNVVVDVLGSTEVENEQVELIENKKKSTLLYIEDNLSNINLVEAILADHRPSTQLVISTLGRNALKLAKEHGPNLILLDLDLPDINGSEVMDRLLADPLTQSIPIIIISADAMPYQIDKLLKAGALDYMTKPLNIMQFLKIIDQYTES